MSLFLRGTIVGTTGRRVALINFVFPLRECTIDDQITSGAVDEQVMTFLLLFVAVDPLSLGGDNIAAKSVVCRNLRRTGLNGGCAAGAYRVRAVCARNVLALHC